MLTNWVPLSFWLKYFLLSLPLTLLGVLISRFLPDLGPALTIIIYIAELIFGFSLIIAATNEDTMPPTRFGGAYWTAVFVVLTPIVSAFVIRDHLALRGVMIFLLAAFVAKKVDGMSITDFLS